ncbi:MAG: TIR domain-containing protein [Saprospiraceae bacterium]|nr:TIR domain-containing protein [Saprospiraceae bacterium]
MKPWNYEAGTINYSLLTEEDLYFNSIIDSYLEIGNHDKKFVLIGPKGIGKTLFIQYKSHLYRENLKEKGFKIYPQNTFCENLMIPNERLSKEDLLKFSTIDFWEKIWLFTLSVIFCKTNELELPEEIIDIIDNSNSCSSIITIILQNRKLTTKYFKAIPQLLMKIEEINNGIGIFIDDVDQAFRKFLQEYHFTDDINDGISPSVQVWTNAQVGLLSSIYSLNRHNSHLKVFATIRSEAFNAQEGEMRLNFKNYCTELKYSKEEIRKIYEINILLMSEKYLIKKSAKDPSEKFVGFSLMPHPFAKNSDGSKKIEATFDFLFRHTLGRPREIVYLGSQIFEDLICSLDYRTSLIDDKIERLRWLANSVGNDILEQYFTEIIPRFNKEDLIKFLNLVQCNVIPSILLNKSIDKMVKHFYSIGILGYIKKKNHSSDSSIFKQVFLPISQYAYNQNITLPKSKYYLTHPTLDDQLKKLFDLGFYNNTNIIGNDYDFIDDEFVTRKFDVALSFASENREYVEQVATYLKTKDVSVFYDNHYKTSLWGKDLYQHLNIIYKNLAKSCVIFISEYYPVKKWTKHELKAAQAREFLEENDYILPVRFDDTVIPGLNETKGFIDGNKITPEELAEAIIEKVKTLPNNVYK